MPTQRRSALRRWPAALAALSAAAVALSACSVVVPLRVAAVVDGALDPSRTAKVVDDPATSSLLIEPAHPNDALAVFVHGSGQRRDAILTEPNEVGVARDLVDHGYLVLAADAGGRAWGDAASVADYERLIAATVRTHHLRDVVLMTASMGGLATMQLAARMPEVRAVVAWFPVCDLRTMAHRPRFAEAIERAWRTGDRRVVSPVAVPKVPLIVWASAGDRVVPAARNAAVCAAEGRAAGAPVTYVHTTGDHGDASNFHPAEVLAFFDAHRSGASAVRPAVDQSWPRGRS